MIFNGPLRVVTILYTALNAIPAGQDQKIGISALGWCVD
jgi:hypothetical protein